MARPPVPSTVAAGKKLPVDSTDVVGPVISVVVSPGAVEPPPRNSETVPETDTESPTEIPVGAALVKTWMPSLVASSASGDGS